MDEVISLKRCAICTNSVLYRGPAMLADGAIMFCDSVCARIWDAATPGQWVDAAELMPGGRLHDRPDIWAP